MKDNITRILHWGFACLLLVILGIGFYMTRTEFSPFLYQMHKSLGVIFSLLIGIRLYWQIKHPWKLATLKNKYERTIRNVIHCGLMILFFVMPILGLMCSGFSGFGISLFNLEIVPENFNVDGTVEPINEVLYKTAKFFHKLLAKVFAVLIFMHVAAVLKHHFINKDGTLTKMLRN
ncbi:cytochrome b [Flagellimonas sp.]|uniref:cytochrome b n=1 Tax=Flagellimonas sp. TaxID=2058762 RepID=UPI003B514180